MADAIARGHRAGQVVGASDAAVDLLLDASGAAPRPPAPWTTTGTVTTESLLAMVRAFDGEGFTAALYSEWGRLGALAFAGARVAPLLEQVGSQWAAGALDIRHAHFLSERLGDLLRSLRMPLDHQASGPQTICATLPDERHAIGLQLAALIMAAAGLRVIYLGTEVPPAELATIASELAARHVVISVSTAADAPAVVRHLRRLRHLLPSDVGVIVGGRGAPVARPGIVVVSDFEQLDAWAGRARADSPPAAAPPQRH